MKREIDMDETYDFIGRLALALFSEGIKMSYSSLMKVLVENNYWRYWSERGVARGIAAAYHRWKKLEEGHSYGTHPTCDAIAATYVNRDGVPSWTKY